MQAFRQLHAPILHQMKNEKVWFDHYWLQQLNLTDCFLLEDADGPSAIVTRSLALANCRVFKDQ